MSTYPLACYCLSSVGSVVAAATVGTHGIRQLVEHILFTWKTRLDQIPCLKHNYVFFAIFITDTLTTVDNRELGKVISDFNIFGSRCWLFDKHCWRCIHVSDAATLIKNLKISDGVPGHPVNSYVCCLLTGGRKLLGVSAFMLNYLHSYGKKGHRRWEWECHDAVLEYLWVGHVRAVCAVPSSRAFFFFCFYDRCPNPNNNNNTYTLEINHVESHSYLHTRKLQI